MIRHDAGCLGGGGRYLDIGQDDKVAHCQPVASQQSADADLLHAPADGLPGRWEPALGINALLRLEKVTQGNKISLGNRILHDSVQGRGSSVLLCLQGGSQLIATGKGQMTGVGRGGLCLP